MNHRATFLSACCATLVLVVAACTPSPPQLEDQADGATRPAPVPVDKNKAEVVAPPPVSPNPPTAPDGDADGAPTPPTPPVGQTVPTVGGLDASGTVIPDTSYPIPAGAVFMAPNGKDSNTGTIDSPVQSIRRAVDLAPVGGTVVLRGGTHRTWYSNPDGTSYAGVGKDLTIQGYPHEQAWFDGADVVGGWAADGQGRWTRSWSTPSFCDGKYYQFPPDKQPLSNTGPCSYEDAARDPGFPMAGDPQMVFVDGKYQRQVRSLSEVTAGTFHYDWAARKLTIGTNPTGRTIEASTRPVALVLGNNRNYKVRGVGFRRYASNQYSNITGAALYLGADRAEIENVVFTQNAGNGIGWATPRNGSSIRRSVFAFNGSIGLGANGSSRTGARNDLLIEGNIFNGNNAERFGAKCVAACGAGNIKLTRMVGFVARGNVIENAPGPMAMGIWCDIDCSDSVIVNNVVRNNGSHGIFYEISSKGIIASNLVVNNGDRGIAVASATTKVYNNTIVTDAVRQPRSQGIIVYDDSRWPNNPEGTGPNTTGVEIVNNIVAGQSGVLMIAHDGPGTQNTKTAQFFTAFDHNAYHHGGQNVVSWVHPDPNIGRYFSSVTDFSKATGLDRNAIEFKGGTDPFFTAATSGNYVVRPGSAAGGSGRALPADVASAIGVPAGVPVDRGAIAWPGR